MAFVTVARLSDLSPGQGVCVEAGGKKLALFLVDGKCFAIDEFCPHRQAPLHEGYCMGVEVYVPLARDAIQPGDRRTSQSAREARRRGLQGPDRWRGRSDRRVNQNNRRAACASPAAFPPPRSFRRCRLFLRINQLTSCGGYTGRRQRKSRLCPILGQRAGRKRTERCSVAYASGSLTGIRPLPRTPRAPKMTTTLPTR